MTSDTPSEEELHAYVDGRLDDARRQAIAFYLTQHPQRANEVRAWQRDAQQLRAALGMLPTEYANPALDPAILRTRRRNRRRARLAMAAMLMLSLGLGGVGGWQARSVSSAGREPPMSDAMQAYRMFAQRGSGALDITAQRRGDLQAWLATHFSHAPTLPDLNAAGFHAAGGRLLALSEGAAAMVLYENAGRRDQLLYPSGRRRASACCGAVSVRTAS